MSLPTLMGKGKGMGDIASWFVGLLSRRKHVLVVLLERTEDQIDLKISGVSGTLG
jgi:hypothetical protein